MKHCRTLVRWSSSVAAAGLILWATACASAAPLRSRAGGRTTGETGSARLVASAPDLAPFRGTSLYDALVRLQPVYLHGRGAIAPDVSVDGQYFAGTSILKEIGAGDVLLVRYLTGPDVFLREGHAHPGGVILVILR